MFVAVLLQIAKVAGTPVTTGVGLTVTVIVYGALAGQLPTVEVGVTRYSTVPAVALLGLDKVCAIVAPDPLDAPVIPPVIVPIVHANVLGAVAVKGIFVAVLLQMVSVAGTPVTTGVGLTVTVIIYGALAGHVPPVDVGVTRYSTEPAVALLGLLKVCPMVFPEEALAPVIPPVIVPIVHANVLGAVAVRGMFVAVLLQIATAEGTPVTTGVGLTVTMIEYGALAGQFPPVEVGVTRYSTVPAVELLGFANVCAMVFPLPALEPLMLPVIVPIVHANELGAVAFKAMFVAVLLQIATVEGTPVTTGVGFTVTVIVYAALAGQLPPVDVGVTRYSTVPAVALLGLVNVCAIVAPDPLAAPVIPPVIVPTVQAKVLGAVAVKGMFVAVLLQIATVAGTPVTTGVGLTVTVMV
jgi:hypothetical protein